MLQSREGKNERGSGQQREAMLKADCEKCFGLCCVALYFTASDGFPVDKAGGEPCPNLQDDFRCSVHENLSGNGLKGCRGYDCFGAGPKIARETYKGISWRQAEGAAEEMFGCYLIMRQLQELLLYLTQAMGEKAAFSIYDSLSKMFEETKLLTERDPEELMKLDIETHRRQVNSLLLKTSEFTRSSYQSKGKRTKNRKNEPGPGKDLIGLDLRTVDFVGANLRGAYLIGADMRGCSLKGTDLIGADLRDADIRGADLSESIFLNQGQVNLAKGDIGTQLPCFLVMPDHWVFKGSRSG